MLRLLYVAVGMVGAMAICVATWLVVPFTNARLEPTVVPAPAVRAGLAPPWTASPAAILRTQDVEPKTESVEGLPEFDVVRLDPEGASVFAGRALPNQLVTILINGREFARARADSAGQWAVVIERSLPVGQVELALVASGPEPGRRVRGQVLREVIDSPKVASVVHEARPSPRIAQPQPPPSKTAKQDDKQALQRFEAFVDRARIAAAETPPAPVVQAPVPVPITFLTAEPVMTTDGGKAARLLSDYLRITKSSSIVLTGHADSRGPDGYNFELSRKRLVAIEQLLRADGYDGGLKLVPLGESAPYQGVDRSRLPRSEVLQMDRRVELQITR